MLAFWALDSLWFGAGIGGSGASLPCPGGPYPPSMRGSRRAADATCQMCSLTSGLAPPFI